MSRFHSWGVCRLCSSQQKWRIFPFVSLSLSAYLLLLRCPHAFPCNQPAPTLYKEDSVPFSNCVIPSAADIYSRRGFPAIDIIIPKFPFFTVCKLLREKRKRHLFFFLSPIFRTNYSDPSRRPALYCRSAISAGCLHVYHETGQQVLVVFVFCWCFPEENVYERAERERKALTKHLFPTPPVWRFVYPYRSTRT